MSDINAEWREKRRWRHVKPRPILHVGPKLSEAPIEEPQEDLAAVITALRRRLKREIVALKAKLKFRRLLRFLHKYDPNQPRDEIGRWTDGAGGSAINDARVVSDATPDNDWVSGAQYAAGSSPTR